MIANILEDLKPLAVPLDDVYGMAGNPRNHDERSIAGIMRSLEAYGQRKPIVTRVDTGEVIAGNGTLEAAHRLGWTHIARVRVQEDREASMGFAVADNRTGDLSTWAEDSLKEIFASLAAGSGLDEIYTGFDREDIAAMFGDLEDLLPPAPEKEPKSSGGGGGEETEDPADSFIVLDPSAWLEKWQVKSGECFLIGSVHRLMCGDSEDAAAAAKLLNGTSASMLMVTDPPYGVDYDPEWRNELDVKRKRASRQSSGKIANDKRADWGAVFKLWNPQVLYVWHSMLEAETVARSIREAGFEVRTQIIWNKPIHTLSRGHYHPKHEPCYFAVRKGATANWQGSRKETTVWDVSNAAWQGRMNDSEEDSFKTGHTAQKPVELFRRSIKNHTEEGDWVCDPFAGSGSSVLAAAELGRKIAAMELKPAWCSAILERCERAGLKIERVASYAQGE